MRYPICCLYSSEQQKLTLETCFIRMSEMFVSIVQLIRLISQLLLFLEELIKVLPPRKPQPMWFVFFKTFQRLVIAMMGRDNIEQTMNRRTDCPQTKVCTSQSHYRVVKWNLIFFNFARLRHVINKQYEADVILYSRKKFQPNLCTCARARSKNLKFPVLN